MSNILAGTYILFSVLSPQNDQGIIQTFAVFSSVQACESVLAKTRESFTGKMIAACVPSDKAITTGIKVE